MFSSTLCVLIVYYITTNNYIDVEKYDYKYWVSILF